ncbi:uncharacterized protein NEMAJ01_1221 [Nematocida major]|uniref:uncharacterized protein n=1 Tax=Nematocida major TaxID=1912982 RepID=UPI002007BC52|nr:uncharacterized protein NEMAJ01_1221 [Nematocida major]KAH9386325.1 hypothetical protein NEMAJ01_1221 [Nematocida major]
MLACYLGKTDIDRNVMLKYRCEIAKNEMPEKISMKHWSPPNLSLFEDYLMHEEELPVDNFLIIITLYRHYSANQISEGRQTHPKDLQVRVEWKLPAPDEAAPPPLGAGLFPVLTSETLPFFSIWKCEFIKSMEIYSVPPTERLRILKYCLEPSLLGAVGRFVTYDDSMGFLTQHAHTVSAHVKEESHKQKEYLFFRNYLGAVDVKIDAQVYLGGVQPEERGAAWSSEMQSGLSMFTYSYIAKRMEEGQAEEDIIKEIGRKELSIASQMLCYIQSNPDALERSLQHMNEEEAIHAKTNILKGKSRDCAQKDSKAQETRKPTLDAYCVYHKTGRHNTKDCLVLKQKKAQSQAKEMPK